MAPNTLPAMAKATGNYANSGLIKMQARSTATLTGSPSTRAAW